MKIGVEQRRNVTGWGKPKYCRQTLPGATSSAKISQEESCSNSDFKGETLTASHLIHNVTNCDY